MGRKACASLPLTALTPLELALKAAAGQGRAGPKAAAGQGRAGQLPERRSRGQGRAGQPASEPKTGQGRATQGGRPALFLPLVSRVCALRSTQESDI